ncbi:hypothetical protein GCM10009601_12090 [Streptomyces thermospinosisporus]|uniref:Uncharacterized protein n=1 Tax=Streptomyces thermospinosisporus TaxID=161482 RepID=A0ABP4JD91_9ACTN
MPSPHRHQRRPVKQHADVKTPIPVGGWAGTGGCFEPDGTRVDGRTDIGLPYCTRGFKNVTGGTTVWSSAGSRSAAPTTRPAGAGTLLTRVALDETGPAAVTTALARRRVTPHAFRAGAGRGDPGQAGLRTSSAGARRSARPRTPPMAPPGMSRTERSSRPG